MDKIKFSLPSFPPFTRTLPKLHIGNSVIDIPIIQGGMGVGISLANLAAAVSNAGGLGVIAANAIGMLEPDYFKQGREANRRALKKELNKFREQSDAPVGVNIMVAGNDFYHMLDVCIAEKADVVFLGAGLPIKDIPVERIRKAGVKVVPIISSARACRLIFQYWLKHYRDIPDGVVVEGPLAGGHLGFKPEQISKPEYQLERILVEVIETLSGFHSVSQYPLPVIAAGGIFNGSDIYKFHRLGANGFQLGSRFVTTHECDAHIDFKKSYLKCKKPDIKIIQSPVGLPGRAITGPFFKKLPKNTQNFTQCAWRCLNSCGAQKARFCIAVALNHARKGNLKLGFAFAGANAYRIKKIIPVRQLIESLRHEFQTAFKKDNRPLRREYKRMLKKIIALKKEYYVTLEKTLTMLKQKATDMMAKKRTPLMKDTGDLLKKMTILRSEYYDLIEKLTQMLGQLQMHPAQT